MASKDGRSSSASSHSGSSNIPTGRTPSVRTPKRKKPSATSLLDAVVKDSDYLCPVCFNLIEEAHITRCGHTFCYGCITKSIESNKKCPQCQLAIPNEEMIIPNFMLNDLINKHKIRMNGLQAISRDNSGEFGTSADGLRDFVALESQNLTLPDVNVMLEILTQRKQLLEAESCAAQNKLLLEFLKHLLLQKREQKTQVLKELSIVERDIEDVENKLKEVHSKCPTLEDVERVVATVDNNNAKVSAMKKEMMDLIDNIGSAVGKTDDCSGVVAVENNTTPSRQLSNNSSSALPSLATRRKRMHAHFDDFVQCYFNSRSRDLFFGKEPSAAAAATGGTSDCSKSTRCASQPSGDNCRTSGLDEFRENLVKFSRYNELRRVTTLNYSSDIFNNSTIVSSIEFDKDNEFFAIAGVTKRIKVFDYGAVVRDVVGIHYPSVEMVSYSKISCVSWNGFRKGVLASSDYDGTVTIWDATTGQKTKTFQEHEKRCWSVDFNAVDTRLLASGSDDARVKLYALDVEHSIANLEAKANVCCVKFNPASSFHLAFGSADHCVHYYDLRNMKEAVTVFKGHKKAVSYVKFLNSEHIVSASTDSQLKMWNVCGGSQTCLRSFVGHVNEKNFVGLATDGDYVACGSENNALYVYYKGLTRKLFSYKFEAMKGVLDQQQERREDDPNEFVSAVCWKQNSNVVVAANSQGTINILELV